MPQAGEFRHVSVSLRITVTVLVLAALALFALAVVACRLALDSRLSATQSELRRFANALEPLARDALADPTRGNIWATHARLSTSGLGFTFAVYGVDAQAVVPADRTTNPRIRLVLSSRTPHQEISRGEAAATVVYRAPLLAESGGLLGAIELTREVPLAFPGRGWLFVGGVAWLAVLGLLVGFYVRRVVGRPLHALLLGVDRVIQGDLGAALPIGRSDEIGELAYRFNEMTARLRDAQAGLRKSEAQLRHSEKLATVGQLAAEIAHEIGTPLGVIAGRARKMTKKSGSTETTNSERNAEIIAEQADRIRRIIQRLLDLARRGTQARTSLDVNAVVKKALEFVEDQIEHAQVRLEFQANPALPLVRASADEIEQVCLNLFLNALAAMPQGGKLCVNLGTVTRGKEGLRLAPAIEYVVIEVSDTGPGIPAQDRARIFEPFFSTKADGGTGLGLPVSLGIVKDHDGWIEVDERSGGGTVFRVGLPKEGA